MEMSPPAAMAFRGLCWHLSHAARKFATRNCKPKQFGRLVPQHPSQPLRRGSKSPFLRASMKALVPDLASVLTGWNQCTLRSLGVESCCFETSGSQRKPNLTLKHGKRRIDRATMVPRLLINSSAGTRVHTASLA